MLVSCWTAASWFREGSVRQPVSLGVEIGSEELSARIPTKRVARIDIATNQAPVGVLDYFNFTGIRIDQCGHK